MTVPRPTLFFSPARERSQQARVLLIMGIILALGSAYELVQQWPAWRDIVAVSDDQRIYLVGRTESLNGPIPAVFATSSADGVQWSAPFQRDLSLRASAACDGWLYLLLETSKDESQLNAYGPNTWKGEDDWKVIDLPPGFTALGIDQVGARIWVFGPKRAPASKTTAGLFSVASADDKSAADAQVSICTAYREGAAWVDGPTLTLSEGKPAGFSILSDSSGAYLYWRLVPAGAADVLPKLYRARLDLAAFGPVESFDLPGVMDCVLVGEGDHTLILAQSLNSLGWPVPPIHRFIIAQGKLAPAPEVRIDRFGSEHVFQNPIAATRFHDKTRLFAAGSSYGIFLSGLYAFQLDGSTTDSGSLAVALAPQQTLWIRTWLTQALLALALLVAACVGYLRKRVPLHPPFADSPMIPATVLERAVATSFDIAFMVPIYWLLVGLLDRPPAEAGLAAVIAWFAYTIFSESSSGRTLGKRVVGLQVLGADQRPPAIGAAILRNLLKPLELFTIGPALILGTARSQRLADLLTHSVVVFNPIVPPPPVPKENDPEGF